MSHNTNFQRRFEQDSNDELDVDQIDLRPNTQQQFRSQQPARQSYQPRQESSGYYMSGKPQQQNNFQQRFNDSGSEEDRPQGQQPSQNQSTNNQTITRSNLQQQAKESRPVQPKDKQTFHQSYMNEAERAIQIVKFIPEQNRFEFNEDALEILGQIQGPIGFISLCGKYRTGKSFLLNRLLDIQGDGFRVEATTASCTQGIWMYSRPVYNSLNGMNIFFLDTEGTESIERSATHDSKIFALAILMSSYFVFNSVGCIDEQSISQLQLTTTLAKTIQVQETNNPNDPSGLGNEGLLGYYTPKFMWILRDFVLDIRDKYGKSVSSKEYLDNALQDETAHSKASEANRRIRKSLLMFFKDRDCITMVRPVTDESELKQLNQLPVSKLRKEFQIQLSQLKDTLIKNCQAKQLNGVNLNGRMFCEMVKNYIQILNRGGVPNIASAWEHIVQKECETGFDEAMALYQQLLTENFAQDEAKSFEELFQILKTIRDQAYERFHALAGIREKNNFYEAYKQRLKDEMNTKESFAIKLNEDMNSSRNEELISSLSQELVNNLNNEIYTADDLDAFFSDFNQFLNAYDQQASGSNKSEQLIRFFTNFHPTLIKRLINSIKVRYEKVGRNAEAEQAIFKDKEMNYRNNISVLEEKIQKHEQKIKKLDQEKLQLEQQKNEHQQKLEKIQKENEAITKNMRNVQDLNTQLRARDEEIMQLKHQIQGLQQKKKKGCCG